MSGYDKFDFLGKIDANTLIFANLFGAGEEVYDDKKFRRRIQYCLNLLTGHLNKDNTWAEDKVKKIKEGLKTLGITEENNPDHEFLLHSYLAEEIIKHLGRNSMLRKEDIVEGILE